MCWHRIAAFIGIAGAMVLCFSFLPTTGCTTTGAGGGGAGAPADDGTANGDDQADVDGTGGDGADPGEGVGDGDAADGGADDGADEDDGTEADDGGAIPANLVQPADLEYRGVFRLPAGDGVASWDWGGTGLTYYAGGDPGGPDDGYPGSLYGTGHEHQQMISEVTIPVPVISADRDVEELNTATTLQDFHDVRGEIGVVNEELEQARAGLACLPSLGEQTTDKLYFCWGEHFQYELYTSHGWCELDLSDANPAGPWYIGEIDNHSTNDFMFEIPADWADANVAGRRLATGRFREGGLGGQGPSLFAIAPWDEGNPPPPDTHLEAVTLLRYTSAGDWEAEPHTLDGYHHSDDWSGGAWLTTESTAAVAFVGTKGLGECWYGFANGVVWPEEAPYPEVPDPPYDNRGYWSTEFEARILLYDPADLAAVVAGTLESHEPQPYATIPIEELLFNPQADLGRTQLGGAAYDANRALLYIVEFRGDVDRPLVHVWHVAG